MLLSREETAKLLQVTEKYLCPSNFERIQGGAKLKGYNLISIQGRGKNAIFEIEPIQNDYEDEIWKPFPLESSYLVSNYGRIKNPQDGILKGTVNKGYLRTRIKGLGQLFNHRMVMLTFNPIENAEMFSVDHINGKRQDNRLINLRWVLQSENMQFCDKNNTEIKEIIAKLVQKYGYNKTKAKLNAILEENL